MPETQWGWVQKAVIGQDPIDIEDAPDELPDTDGWEGEIIGGIRQAVDKVVTWGPLKEYLDETGKQWTEPLFGVRNEEHGIALDGPTPGQIASAPLRLVQRDLNRLEEGPIGHTAEFDWYARGVGAAADIVESEQGGQVISTLLIVKAGMHFSSKAAQYGGKKISEKLSERGWKQIDKKLDEKPNYTRKDVDDLADKNRSLKWSRRALKIGYGPQFPAGSGTRIAQQAIKVFVQTLPGVGPALGKLDDHFKWSEGYRDELQGKLDEAYQRKIEEEGLGGYIDQIEEEVSNIQDIADEVAEEIIKVFVESQDNIAAWVKEKVKNGKYIELLYGSELNYMRRQMNGKSA